MFYSFFGVLRKVVFLNKKQFFKEIFFEAKPSLVSIIALCASLAACAPAVQTHSLKCSKKSCQTYDAVSFFGEPGPVETKPLAPLEASSVSAMPSPQAHILDVLEKSKFDHQEVMHEKYHVQDTPLSLELKPNPALYAQLDAQNNDQPQKGETEIIPSSSSLDAPLELRLSKDFTITPQKASSEENVADNLSDEGVSPLADVELKKSENPFILSDEAITLPTEETPLNDNGDPLQAVEVDSEEEVDNEGEFIAQENPPLDTEEETNTSIAFENKSQRSPLYSRNEGVLLTMPEVISRAATLHPEIALALARVDEASSTKDITKAGLGPTVTATLGAGQNTIGSTSLDPYRFSTKNSTGFARVDAGITLKQMIFDFNSTKQKVLSNVANVDSQKFSLMDVTENLVLRTANAYLRVMEQRELLALADENIVAHERLSKIVEANLDEGNATVADVERITVRLIEAQAVRTDLETKLEEAADEFKRLARIEPTRLKKPRSLAKSVPPSPEHAMELMRAHNPKLLASLYTIRSAEHEIAAINASDRARVDLEVDSNVKNYIGQNSRSDIDVRGMVVFSYKLYDSGRNKGEANQARARMRQAKARYIDRQDKIENDIRQSYRVISAAQQKLKVLREGVTSSVKVKELYEEQFGAGKRTIFELLDAQNSLYVARRDLIESQYQELRGQYAILQGAGRLTTTLIGANYQY